MTEPVEEDCPVCNSSDSANAQFATAKVAEHITERARHNETHQSWIDEHTTNGTLAEIREALTEHTRVSAKEMNGDSNDASAGILARVRPILRIGIAALLLGPGVSKFLTYGRSVQFFETLGLPAPAVLVLVVGTIELGIAVLLFLDQAPRAAALTVVPVMIVAAMTAGPTWQNLGVLFAAVVLIGIDTKSDGVFSTEPTT